MQLSALMCVCSKDVADDIAPATLGTELIAVTIDVDDMRAFPRLIYRFPKP